MTTKGKRIYQYLAREDVDGIADGSLRLTLWESFEASTISRHWRGFQGDLQEMAMIPKGQPFMNSVFGFGPFIFHLKHVPWRPESLEDRMRITYWMIDRIAGAIKDNIYETY